METFGSLVALLPPGPPGPSCLVAGCTGAGGWPGCYRAEGTTSLSVGEVAAGRVCPGAEH